ncbi:hypothetical protein D3C77_487710 [compost metagenome]
MGDLLVEIAVLHFPKGLDQLVQRLVNVFVDVERVNDDDGDGYKQQQNEPAPVFFERLKHRMNRNVFAEHRTEEIRIAVDG